MMQFRQSASIAPAPLSPEAVSSRLKQLKRFLTPLTGIEWVEGVHKNQPALLSDTPMMDRYHVDFISQVFQERLGLSQSGISTDYLLIEDVEEKAWQWRVFALPPEKIQAIEKLHRREKVQGQKRREIARTLTDQLHIITGRRWHISEREECLLAPLYLLGERKEQDDSIILLRELLNNYCYEKGRDALTFKETRVDEKKHWKIEFSDSLRQAVEAHYTDRKQAYERACYRAKQIAKKLNSVLSHGVFVDVESSLYFCEEVKLFAECTSRQLIYLSNVLRENEVLRVPYEQKENRISFNATAVKRAALEKYVEKILREKQRAQAESANQALLFNLQEFIAVENHALRDQVLQAVSLTEKHLARQLSSMEERMFTVHDRLVAFENRIMTELNVQGDQLRTLQAAVDRTQESLVMLAEQQRDAFAMQRSWLKTQLENKLDSAVAISLHKEWLRQIKKMLKQAFATQEKALADSLSAHMRSQTTDLLSSWETRLTAFQMQFTQDQEARWARYSSEVNQYLEKHALSLERRYYSIENTHQRYEDLIEKLFARIASLKTLSREAVCEALINEVKLQDLDEAFLLPLMTMDEALFSSREALKGVVQILVQTSHQRIVQSEAITCLVQTGVSANVPAEQKNNDQNFFETLLVRRAKESIELITQVSEGIDVEQEEERLGEQLADVAEMASDAASIVVPGLRLIVKATTFGVKKYLNYREQRFSELILKFLLNENVESLIRESAQTFLKYYKSQIEQLTSRSIERFIEGYLLPCFLAEMAKPRSKNLSTIEKQRLLVHSGENRTPLLPIKLTTHKRRKTPWTAAGLVLGPAVEVTVNDEKRYYIRTDNVLKLLPWQPKAHLLYGVRLGEVDEVLDQAHYCLLNTAPVMESHISHHAPVWVLWSGKSGDQIVQSLLENSDILKDQDESGQSCFMFLAKTRGPLLRCLTLLCDHVESFKEQGVITQEHLLACVCLTDENEKNLLHYYVEAEASYELLELDQLYAQLIRLGRLSLWNQQRDVDQCMVLDRLSALWKSKPHVFQAGFSRLVSENFAWGLAQGFSGIRQLYPWKEWLKKLDFSGLISPWVSLYQDDTKEFLSSLLDSETPVNLHNKIGDNLLHAVVKADDRVFFETLVTQVGIKRVSESLSDKNNHGETPLILAVKLEKVEFLWCMARQTALMDAVHESWGLTEAKIMSKEKPELAKPLEAFLAQDAGVKLKTSVLNRFFKEVRQNHSALGNTAFGLLKCIK